MDIILNGASGRMGMVITKKVNDGYQDAKIVAIIPLSLLPLRVIHQKKKI